ncbi:50s ribosomal protein l16 [Plasmopara halstedii]|uniref:50s ribosomal protein l16 n=1 Tax=Plasmopara halstedii TaxID=4781 RepID=A0A0P1BRR6_PLAHL|nr:50s ribosomal protein l16 [Plasmopara halstedii]CEI80203.1 50s ribosomal protein l16 [Plasmopara halstedii]|eukprot:XP_024586897.1 50s ribosomal protein l16 [Plasmopara halstedii]
MKKLGFLWVRIFPDIPVTTKPTENRMGKGKGSVSFWVAKIKKGQILYEISGIPLESAKKILKAGAKHTAHNGIVVGSSPTKPN